MCYRVRTKAWLEFDGQPLLERRSGRKGGETLLTAETRLLVENFRQLLESLIQSAELCFEENFPQ